MADSAQVISVKLNEKMIPYGPRNWILGKDLWKYVDGTVKEPPQTATATADYVAKRI